MDANRDFKDLLVALNNERARFLVVGAYAVIYHTEPRYTKDLDLWVEATPANAERVWRALTAFGAPLACTRQSDFADERLIYSMGLEPSRVDILMGLPSLKFDVAWKRCIRTTYADIPIYVLSRNDLIRVKTAAGRPQDLLDVRRLREGVRKPRRKKR